MLGASEHSKDRDTGWIWAAREPCRGQWSLYLVQSAVKLDNDIHSYHFTCHRSQPSITDWLHHSSPNLPVRFPLINFLHDKHHEGPVLLRNKRSFQQIAWLALNIWDLPEQLAQWFEKAVSPVETASMIGVEKLFFSRFIPVVTGWGVKQGGFAWSNRQVPELCSSDTVKAFQILSERWHVLEHKVH